MTMMAQLDTLNSLAYTGSDEPVTLAAESGLRQPGSLRAAMPHSDTCDAAFSDSVEAEVSALITTGPATT